MKLFKYFSSSSPTKIYPLSLFSFLSHASFVQSRYKKKRVCPGLRSQLERSFCTSTHTFRSLMIFIIIVQNIAEIFSTLVRCRRRKKKRKRDTARARATTKRKRYKKTERKTPQNREKKREKRFYNITTLACGLQKRSHQI